MHTTVENSFESSEKSDLGSFPEHVQKRLREIFGEDVTKERLEDESVEDNEDIFELFGDKLPSELINQIVLRSTQDNHSLLKGLNRILEIIAKRENTWVIDGNEKYKEEAEKTILELSGARFHSDLFLGKGNAGHVFEVPGAKDYCIKYLHSPARQASTIEGEFNILGSVGILADQFQALKVPQAHCLAKNMDGTKSFFTMQKIKGRTLEQLVDYPSFRQSEYPDLSTEKMISILRDPTLRKKLSSDLTLLHQSGIIHGDIHPRNIMLDVEGNVILIDFGNAVIPVNVSVHATYDNVENVKELDIKTFFNSMEQTAAYLERQVNKT